MAGLADLPVTRHVLDNGMRFLIVPFGDAPFVATLLLVGVGGVDDPKGATGVAHLLEHMMFKGTTTLGTTGHDEERPHLERRWDAHRALDVARRAGAADDVLDALRAEVEAAEIAHEPFVVKNEITQIYRRCGGTGLNATTTKDFTWYYVTLPSNQLEVWARVEADRLTNPVFREFYTERDVVGEERRLRVDSSDRGRHAELFDLHAWLVHPYRQPVIGYPQDIAASDHAEVLRHFQTYYAPSNCVVALVGDVDPESAIELAERRFGAIPDKPTPRRAVTPEPPPAGVLRLEVPSSGRRQMTVAWHVPAYGHEDMAALEIAAHVLAGTRGLGGRGRSADGRLTRNLARATVREGEVRWLGVAVQASASVGFGRYPGLFRVDLSPAHGVEVAEAEKAVCAEVARLVEEPPTAEELERIRIAAAAAAIRGMRTPMGIARALTRAEALVGDWRAVDRQHQALLEVGPDDVARVASKYLVHDRRVVAVELGFGLIDDEALPDDPQDGE